MVAGIVSAVVAVCNLITKAAASCKVQNLTLELDVETAEKQLINTMQGSPHQIYDEFARDLASAGTVFAKGDGNLMKLKNATEMYRNSEFRSDQHFVDDEYLACYTAAGGYRHRPSIF